MRLCSGSEGSSCIWMHSFTPRQWPSWHHVVMNTAGFKVQEDLTLINQVRKISIKLLLISNPCAVTTETFIGNTIPLPGTDYRTHYSCQPFEFCKSSGHNFCPDKLCLSWVASSSGNVTGFCMVGGSIRYYSVGAK